MTTFGDQKPRAFDGLRLFLTLLAISAFLFATYFLAVGFTNGTLDFHAFRQSQTAISAYWLNHGGGWLAYETPVLGSPWAIPFEFPLYQWIVALIARSGLTINEAGRLVSFVFLVATLVPMSFIMKQFARGREATLVFAALYLASPLYLFWGRSVMIETTAVFFCACWLALMVRCFRTPTIPLLAGTLVCGTLAVLIKITTFPSFALVAGYFCVQYWLQDFRWRSADSIKFLAMSFALVFVPVVIGALWIRYGDGVKSLNEIAGASLSSRALTTWNFGTLDQRLSWAFWHDAIYRRTLSDIFGFSTLAALLVLASSFITRRSFGLCALCIVAFLAPMVIFTNLHFIHSYYPTGNALWAIAAVAIAAGALAQQGRRLIAGLFVAIICIGQLVFFAQQYAPLVTHDDRSASVYAASVAARELTNANSSLIVFGTDWSAEVPYYAERKGLAVPDWISTPFLMRLLKDLAIPDWASTSLAPRFSTTYLSGHPLGLIVDCYADDSMLQAALVKHLLREKTVLRTYGNCRLIKP